MQESFSDVKRLLPNVITNALKISQLNVGEVLLLSLSPEKSPAPTPGIML